MLRPTPQTFALGPASHKYLPDNIPVIIRLRGGSWRHRIIPIAIYLTAACFIILVWLHLHHNFFIFFVQFTRLSFHLSFFLMMFFLLLDRGAGEISPALMFLYTHWSHLYHACIYVHRAFKLFTSPSATNQLLSEWTYHSARVLMWCRLSQPAHLYYSLPILSTASFTLGKFTVACMHSDRLCVRV